MANKKVLMACANYWTSPYQVGSHQLAREFVREGYEVAFVSDPISPLHGFKPGAGLADRLRLYGRGGIRDLGGKLWAYVPGALLTPHNKPLLRSRWVQDHWPGLSYPNVVLKTVREGFGKVDLLYFDSVAQSFWLKYIQAEKTIFRVADNNAGFDKSTAAAGNAERDLAQKVDAVIYTAQSLKDKVASLGSQRIFHLPNGVNFAHFQKASRERPKEYGSIRGPVVVYVGALESWFDWGLLLRTAKKMPGVSFFMIGKGGEPSSACPRNVHLLGTRPYSRIPAYLWNADAGIIPFRVREYPELVNSIHPLKLYEYMACGLPVVATEWRELKNLKSPALLSRTEDLFAENLERVLKGKMDRKKMIRYAEKQDWSERMGRLRKFVGGMK